MNDSKKEIEINDKQTSILDKKISHSIGQTLKQSRTSQKIEIDQVCNQLNLSKHVIEALESDNYEGLPEIAYVRGYIVSYCRLLGLDSFQVLQQLVSEDPSLSISNSITSSVAKSSNNDPSFIKKFLPVTFVCLIAIAGFWLFNQKDVLLPNSENQVNSTDLQQDQESNVNSNSRDNSLVEGEAQQETEKTVNDAEIDEETVIVDKEKESLLELEFNSVSWVDIQNPKKEKVVYKSFPRGEKHQIKAQLPLNIFIDNAAGVSMRYEGRLIDLSPYIQDGYAKFTLNE